MFVSPKKRLINAVLVNPLDADVNQKEKMYVSGSVAHANRTKSTKNLPYWSMVDNPGSLKAANVMIITTQGIIKMAKSHTKLAVQ